MADDITVIVTTFGSAAWEQLAWSRAIPNASEQATTVSLHVAEPVSLGEARNRAVDFHDPQGWLCFMDADDELEPGYIEAMTCVIDHPSVDCTELLAPSLRFFANGLAGPLELLEHRDIMYLNPCPIGTLIHRSRFEEAGRFWDEPAWEDWALFQRAWLLGSKIVFVSEAVYRSHADAKGRNSTVRNPRQLHKTIISGNVKWMERRGS